MSDGGLRPTERGVPIRTGAPAERVFLVTHRVPGVTEAALPVVLSIFDEAGVEVLVADEEKERHPALADRRSREGVVLREGGVDLVVVMAGDGTILRALGSDGNANAPVLGVNYGRVGFLASIEKADLERGLRRALRGDYLVIELPALSAKWAGSEVTAVNDLALLRGGEARIAELTFAIDGDTVATVRCDGMVCSTPVGSTAYNLALGGPAVSWRVRCFVLSFLAAHHLEARPLVIGAGEELTVTSEAIAGDCDVLMDGRRVGGLPPGRSITVGLGDTSVHLATFPEESFFRRYRDKFGRPS
jgi:NAD+ kinase